MNRLIRFLIGLLILASVLAAGVWLTEHENRPRSLNSIALSMIRAIPGAANDPNPKLRPAGVLGLGGSG